MFTVNAEQPKYHGPFSASTLKSVGQRFSNEMGLRFRIMPSYDNPLRHCIGIEMETISCFKHEREILLVDQYIPIRSTKTYQTNPSLLVDLIMFTVKRRKSEIRNQNQFFRKLGIRFDPKWMPLIKEHSELFELSAFGGRLVIARLYMELDIWSDDWVPLKVTKENADKDLLIYCVEKRRDKRQLPLYRVLMSRFKVFQSHSLKRCWKVEFNRCTKMDHIDRAGPYEQRLDEGFKDTVYHINGSSVESGFRWYHQWPKDTVIHRIDCRNTKLFGNQVVWTQAFDSSMDADPKDFVVHRNYNVHHHKERIASAPYYGSHSTQRPHKRIEGLQKGSKPLPKQPSKRMPSKPLPPLPTARPLTVSSLGSSGSGTLGGTWRRSGGGVLGNLSSSSGGGVLGNPSSSSGSGVLGNSSGNSAGDNKSDFWSNF